MSGFDEYTRRTWVPEKDIAAEQSELATSLRVPILATKYPRWNYITGIVIDHELGAYSRFPGSVPTDAEVRMVGSFLQEYCEHWYNERFRQVMKDFAPYDIDGGANLAYLLKRGDDSWSYCKRTWRSPGWWPDAEQTVTLAELLDQIHRGWNEDDPDAPTKRWVAWKTTHPDIFGGDR